MHRIKQAKDMKVEILLRGVLIVSALAFFAACEGANDSVPASHTQSAVPDTPEADRERLLTRVKDYWQARMAYDPKATFQYEHPERQQQLGEGTYQANLKANISIKEFSIVNVKDFELSPQALEAEIPIQLKYEYGFPQPGTQPMLVPTQVVDRWKKDQGVWYHMPDTNVIARGKPGRARDKTQGQPNASDPANTN